MATTKKTPKAKTKTTKKPSSKKTAAASTTKATKTSASTSKKAPVTKKADTKTAKKSVVKKTDRKVTLRRLNLLSAALGVLGALAAGLLMSKVSYQMFTGLLTTNPLTGGLAPAVHVVYDVELRWVVVAILVLSAIVPLLAATRSRKMYEASLDQKIMSVRWIDMGLIGGLIVATVALLSGVQDIMTLVLIGGFVAVTCALGLMAEKQNAGAERTYRGAYKVGLVTGVMPWLLIAVYAIGTPIWGQVHNVWAVYALYVALILSFTGAVMSQRNYIDRKADYDVTEQRYLTYSILTKIAFVLFLVLGFKK